MVAGPWYKTSPSQGTFSNTASTTGGTVIIDLGDYDYDSTAMPARLTSEQVRSLRQCLTDLHTNKRPSVTVDTISHTHQNTSNLSNVQPATSGDTRPLGVRRASSIAGVRYCAVLHERKDLRPWVLAHSRHGECKNYSLVRSGKNSGVQFRPKRFLCSKRIKARQQL